MSDLSAKEEFWFDRGYVSVAVAAEKTKRSVWTIYRAIKAGQLEVKIDETVQGGKGAPAKFVSIKSLIQWIGVDTAKAYGLLPSKKA